MLRHIEIVSLISLSQVGAALVSLLFPPPAIAQSNPTLGWYQIPNTRLRSVCAAENGFPQVSGDCANITAAWSGGVFDTKRNRLIVWGGGHNDYYGNEIYALTLDDLTMRRLNDPGLPIGSFNPCQEAIANGTQANSRHTYDGIEYMPNVDRMFVFGGSLACGSGAFGRDTWTFDFATMRWERMNPSGPTPRAVPGVVTGYDPNTGLVFLHDRENLYSYNFSTNTYTLLSGSQPHGYHMNGVIDPERKLFLIVGYDSSAGAGRVYSYDISPGSSYAKQTRNTTGGSAIVGDIYPGLAYDPVTDRIVAWSGGNTVYSLNLDTNTWASTTYSGGPSAMANGTNGRWQYSAKSGVFVTVNSIDNNASSFRLTPAGTPPAAPNALRVQ